jgi:hypothetical protein
MSERKTLLGWLDQRGTSGRDTTTGTERFPWASAVLSIAGDHLADRIPLDPNTFVVVMSHNYLRDKAALGSVLGTPGGLRGPARTWCATSAPPR